MQELDVSIYQRDYYLRWAMDPSAALNTYLTFKISGPLDTDKFKKAIVSFVQHTENQRTYFKVDADSIKQIIVDKLEFEIEEHDFSHLSPREREKKVNDTLNKIYNHVFNLHELPLFRYALLRLGSCEFIFTGNLHHIISDNYVASYTLKYLSNKYNELVGGDYQQLPSCPSTRDYISYEKQYYPMQAQETDLNYWEAELADFNISINIPPLRFTKNQASHIRVASENLELDAIQTKKLRQCARQMGVTPFLLLMCIWALLISRYSGQQEIILSYPVDIRPPGFKELLGCFINTTPIKINVDEEKTVHDYIKSVYNIRKAIKPHQRISLFDITRLLSKKIGRQGSAFNISIVKADLGLVALDLFRCKCCSIPGKSRYSTEDLVLHYDICKKTNFVISYKQDFFDSASIKRLSTDLSALMKEFIDSTEKPLKEIGRIRADKIINYIGIKNQSNGFISNNTTLHRLFEEQVKRTPDAIAAIFKEKKYSYSELNKRSNQLARFIMLKYREKKQHDLQADSLIALCVERSMDMLIAMLAILKSGAAYVPLEPSYPRQRLAYLVEDSAVDLVLTQEDVLIKYEAINQLLKDKIILIDSTTALSHQKKHSSDNLGLCISPQNLAYVIYTSGSTGKPKGVMIEHISVVNRLNWMQQNYNLKINDHVLHKTPFSFDVSVWELLWPVLNGAKLVISRPGEHMEPHLLVDTIQYYKITKIHFVPSMLQAFLDYIDLNPVQKNKLNTLDDIFCSGEMLSKTLAKRVLKLENIRLHNLYGPTEACIDVSFYDYIRDIPGAIHSIPIGCPIDNTQLYILDKYLNLCQVGVPGDLYIGGVALARGYLNKQELTKSVFISNPFTAHLDLPSADKIYKTGDIARWLPDTNIEYLGRSDSQIKIRGNRIELGEIEYLLSNHKDLAQAIVIDKTSAEGKYLVAYYIVNKDKKEPKTKDLIAYLSNSLPKHMIPEFFIKLDKIPTTANGKTDKSSLPAPNISTAAKHYVGPTNDTQRQLTKIWCDILKTDPLHIGVNDDFFHSGGNSLSIINLVSKINKKLNLSLTVAWAFKNSTIEQQSQAINNDRISLSAYQPIITIKEQDGLFPLFLVHPGITGAEIYLSMKDYFSDTNSYIGNIYGIDYYNLYHLTKPIKNMELLAKQYISYIKSIQPDGPYFLGGYSYGGAIAYEMTKQLQDLGDTVLSLYLIDTYPCGPKSLFNPENNDKIAKIIRETQQPPTDKFKQLYFLWLKKLGIEEGLIERHQEVIAIEAEIVNQYCMQPLQYLEATLFVTTKLSFLDFSTVHDLEDKRELYNLSKIPYNGFDKVLNNISVHEFATDHLSLILKSKYVKALVEIIEADMNRKIKDYKS